MSIPYEEKRRAFVALVALEEFAHAQAERERPEGYFRKDKMVDYQLTDAIYATFFDESVAASSAVLAAFQQHKNGQSKLWNVLQEDWNPYKYIAQAIAEKSVETDDLAKLHLEGIKTWMKIPLFAVRYAGQTMGSYMWHFDKDYAPYQKPAGFKDFNTDDLRSYGNVVEGQNIFDGLFDNDLESLADGALNLALQKGGPRFQFSLIIKERKVKRYNKELTLPTSTAVAVPRV